MQLDTYVNAPIQYASISASSSGSNTIVSGVANKRIYVVSYVLVAASAVTAQWQSSTGSANLTGAMPLAANGGVGGSYNQSGHFKTAIGDSLILNLGSGVQVSGHMSYVQF